jgi:hypothetical protein
MKLIRTISLSLALATSISPAFADDAKKPTPAPAPGTPSKADVDKFLAFFDKLVDTVVADKDACPKMATDVNKLIDANQDLLKMGAEAKAKGMQLPKDAQDHMMASTKKMMGGMQKCGNDPDVQKAFQRLDMSKKK